VTDVFLFDAVRTPRGKARLDGGLADLSPQELVRTQIEALKDRGGGAIERAEALLLGCVTQSGAQGANIALISKLHSGLDDSVAALTINNYCASGLSAIGQAIAMVGSGQANAVLAGGVEMMSQTPFMSDKASYYSDESLPPRARYIPPVLAADRLANAEGLGRLALDAVALVSQQRATAAEHDPQLQHSRIAVGKLAGEECIRPTTTAESLAAAAPAFGALQADFAGALGGAGFEPIHTLAHAPPVCDGAALALVGGSGIGAYPRARVLAYAESGGDPEASFTAGLAAMDKALARAGLSLDQIDRIEFMEAFAVTIAKFLRDREPHPERVNVAGGHLAKGHPMGASGAILTSTLLDTLDAAKASLGLIVTTGATGVGAAMIVERLN
jgi:acetyl-CoA C-acetyltransferase/acetyl-CoA acyltransferase